MKIDAQLFLRPEQGWRPKRCILNLVRGLPVKHYHLRINFHYAMGVQTFSHDFIGSEFTIELNEIPVNITFNDLTDHRKVVCYQGDYIQKLNAKTQLRILVDKLLAESPRALQYKDESI